MIEQKKEEEERETYTSLDLMGVIPPFLLLCIANAVGIPHVSHVV